MRINLSRVVIAVVAASAIGQAGLAAGAAAAGKPAAAGVTPVQAATPADIARGKALFTGTCGAYCHRPSSAGKAEPGSDAPSLFDCDWLHGGSDAEVFRTITKGVDGTRMVAFGGAIPDADIWRIIAYLRSASQCPVAPKPQAP